MNSPQRGVKLMVDVNSIRAEMARKNITQIQLAKVLGVSARTFSLKLNGVREFTASELYKISKHLNREVSIFFADRVND